MNDIDDDVGIRDCKFIDKSIIMNEIIDFFFLASLNLFVPTGDT